MTLSTAVMQTKAVTLDTTGVPADEASAILVSQKTTFTKGSMSFTQYGFIAVSHPLFNPQVVDNNGKVTENVKLYKPWSTSFRDSRRLRRGRLSGECSHLSCQRV